MQTLYITFNNLKNGIDRKQFCSGNCKTKYIFPIFIVNVQCKTKLKAQP